MTSEMVQCNVWNAAVQGFYYADGYVNTLAAFRTYLTKYYDRSDPLGYGRFLLRNRVPCEFAEPFAISAADQADSESLLEELLRDTEPARLKASYRDEAQMRERTDEHVRIALYAASYAGDPNSENPAGYIASNDSVFHTIEQSAAWKDRPKIHMSFAGIVYLAEWVSGIRLSDQQLVALVFNPTLAAAANDIADDLRGLSEVGINLRSVDMRRLEWDVKQTMQSKVLAYKATAKGDSLAERIEGAIGLAEEAQNLGYSIEPALSDVVREYHRVVATAKSEKEKRERAEQLVQQLYDAASGLTKKGKRRVNKLLRDIGWIGQREDEDADEADQTAGT